MKDLWKSVLVLWMIGVSFGVSAPAQAASGIGPYYATPAWDQKLDTNIRFVVLTNWNSAAVLDRETGLAWEKSPDAGLRSWSDAIVYCARKNVGGRKGWRLPAVNELASLIDPSVTAPPGLTLPAGHPFTNVQPFGYLSATVYAREPTRAWFVGFGIHGGDVLPNVDRLLEIESAKGQVWCVRGGGVLDSY